MSALRLPLILVAIGTAVPGAAWSQINQRRWVQREFRADVISGRSTAAQLGVGIATPLSTYVRGAIALGVGPAWHSGESGLSARLDATGRFVLDPFRQYRWTLYGQGGASIAYDERDEWRPLLIVALGLEGPEARGVVPAFEIGLGGGTRIAAAFRRAIRERR